jgi:hypothetical protein
MSCYLHNLDEVLKEAGIVVTKENRKTIDLAIHRVVGLDHKHCPTAWKAVKEQIANDREGFVKKLKEEMKGA